MLHLFLCWKNDIASNLWTIDTRYATYNYNRMPNAEEIAPADLFTRTKFHHNLEDVHMWGCPAYVLDNTLQQVRKIPKWKPQSHHSIFVGFIPNHSSGVPLILNPATGHIPPKFHGFFDDSFGTVLSIYPEEEPPSFWNEFDIGDFPHSVSLDDNSQDYLDA